jgi:hypothetical protein
VQPAQPGELLGHPAVQTAVLDRQGDPVGDRAQLLGVVALERVVPAPHEHEAPERLVADDQARPRDVPGAVARQEVRDGDVLGGPDPHVLLAARPLALRQAERVLRQVARAHAVVPGDAQRVVGAEREHGDIGAEQLAELDRRALDDRVELVVLGEHGDDLREAGCAQQRARRVALGVLHPLAQLGVLAAGGLQEGCRVRGHSASTETEVMWWPPGPTRRANSP